MKEMVYITNASLKMIVNSLRDVKSSISRNSMLDDFSDDFSDSDFTYNDFDFVFSDKDLEAMYHLKLVLEDFKNAVQNVGKNRQLITDYIAKKNRVYARKIDAPSFHSYKTCKWMNKAFQNIEIPVEFRSNKALCESIQMWIKTNKHLSFEELNSMFKKQFSTSHSLEKVSFENSASLGFENYSIEFKWKSKTIRHQLSMLFNGEFADKIQRYKYAPSYKISGVINNENTKTQEAILDFQSAKQKFEQIVFNYYKRKYNFDLAFEQDILSAIGFHHCKACKRVEISTQHVA